MKKFWLSAVAVFVVASCTSSPDATPIPVTPPTPPSTTVDDDRTQNTLSGSVGDVGSGDRTPAPTPPPAVQEPVGEPVEVTVIADGWSVRIAGTSIVVPGTTITADLSPVTADTLEQFLDAHSTAITAPLARVVSPDWGVGCFTGACFDSAGELDPAWLVDPASIPGYGPSYTAWGVTSTLFTATMVVPDDATIRFASDTHQAAPVAETTVIASAFGSTFTPVATWASGEPETPRSTYTSATPSDWDRPTVPFWAGLRTSEPLSASLGAAQLTWMSSPTVGCGVSALCIPDVVTTDVNAVEPVAPFEVCNADGHIARVEIADVTIGVTYPHETHQAGMWGGSGPLFPGREVSSVKFSGLPPLVTGPQQIRLVAVYWVGADGFKQVDGTLYQVGVDDPAEAARPAADIVADMFPNATWSACST